MTIRQFRQFGTRFQHKTYPELYDITSVVFICAHKQSLFGTKNYLYRHILLFNWTSSPITLYIDYTVKEGGFVTTKRITITIGKEESYFEQIRGGVQIYIADYNKTGHKVKIMNEINFCNNDFNPLFDDINTEKALNYVKRYNYIDVK